MLRQMRKGQSTAEYAIVIGLVIGAAVAMQIYVKRSLQAKVKDAVDYNDPEATKLGMFTTGQYEPQYMTSTMTSTRDASTSETTAAGGGVTRNIGGAGEVSTRTGNQGITGLPVTP